MTETIHTKMHEIDALAREGVGAGEYAAEAREIVREMQKLPLYVLDHDLLRSLDEKAVIKSLHAMHSAGVLRLPFPKMVAEIWSGLPNDRWFILLEDVGKSGAFDGVVVPWLRNSPVDHGIRDPIPFKTQWQLPNEGDAGAEGGFRYEYVSKQPMAEQAFWQIARAIMLCCLMSHVNGIERKVIEAPVKLNKHRARAGKPAIRTHTVVRIGHVYDRGGRAVRVTEGNRRTMPIHMRAAHTRRQWHGEEWLALHPEAEIGKNGVEEGHHLIFVEAVLVNYKDGTDLEKPLPKIVKY